MTNYVQSNLIRELFSKGQPMVFGKGDIIVGSQTESDGVYFIKTGFVKIYSISNSGDEYVHIIYSNGEIFPLAWTYLKDVLPSLFYETISECLIWRISREAFIENVRSNAELSYAFSVQLARQFQASIERINNLEYKKASERIAYRLLFLASRFGVKNRNKIIIEAPITHEILANSINLVRESVSRELEILERQGVIKMEKHRILILDVEALTSKLSDPIDLSGIHSL